MPRQCRETLRADPPVASSREEVGNPGLGESAGMLVNSAIAANWMAHVALLDYGILPIADNELLAGLIVNVLHE